MHEVLNYYKGPIAASGILETLGLTKNNYMVVSAHREENVDDPDCLEMLITSIKAAAKHFSKKIIFSVHPRTRERMKKLGISVDENQIQMLKPLGFIDYIKLQQEAFCVLSDSGTITEESSLLGFPAITIRNAHERPEGMDAGILIMSGLKKDNVIQAISVVTKMPKSRESVSDYQAAHVSQKVLQIIMSYTPYVKQKVWYEV